MSQDRTPPPGVSVEVWNRLCDRADAYDEARRPRNPAAALFALADDLQRRSDEHGAARIAGTDLRARRARQNGRKLAYAHAARLARTAALKV